MIIRSISIENFRSFYGEHTINFEDLKGIYKVSGRIGSGKSTLSMALLYGLFGTINGQNQGDLISWGTKKARISISLISKGHEIEVDREILSKGSGDLNIRVDGERLEASNKRDLQTLIEEYYDVSRLSLELLCIISFNNFRSLSSMNTKDISEFQDSILGFGVLNDYRNVAKDMYKDVGREIVSVGSTISQEEDRIRTIENKPKKIEGDIDELRNELKSLKEGYNADVKRMQEGVDEAQKNAYSLQGNLQNVISEGKRIAKDIDFIKKGVCPTCGAPISQDGLEDLEKKREELQEDYKRLSQSKSNWDISLTHRRDELNNRVRKFNEESAGLTSLIAKLEIQEKYISDDTKELERLKKDLLKNSTMKSELEIRQSKFNDLGKLFGDAMRGKLTTAYIGPINERCKQICAQAQLSYVPVFNEQFRCSIEKCGVMVPVSSLSTGQSKMIDMICILSIISSIINSSRCNIVFLDELFSNLDSGSRDVILRILPTIFSQDSSILIVSHQDLNGELLDGTIELSLEDGHSEIVIKKMDEN